MLRNTAKEWSFNELKDAIDRGEVAEVSVHNDIVSVKTGNSKKYNYQTYVQQNVAEWNIYDTVPEKVNNPDGTESEVKVKVLKATVSFSAYIDNYNATHDTAIKITFNDRNAGSIWSTIIPIVGFVMLVLLAIFLFRSMGGVNKQAMTFGKSRANVQGNVKVRFADVAGAEEEKEELKEFYPEFLPYEPYCRFGGCVHLSEPVCGVKEALAEGEISPIRYENYKLLYQELKERKKY